MGKLRLSRGALSFKFYFLLFILSAHFWENFSHFWDQFSHFWDWNVATWENTFKWRQKMLKIFSKKVAYEMRKRGCKIIGTEPNPNFPQYDVYLFEDTEAARAIFEELMKAWKSR